MKVSLSSNAKYKLIKSLLIMQSRKKVLKLHLLPATVVCWQTTLVGMKGWDWGIRMMAHCPLTTDKLLHSAPITGSKLSSKVIPCGLQIQNSLCSMSVWQEEVEHRVWSSNSYRLWERLSFSPSWKSVFRTLEYLTCP